MSSPRAACVFDDSFSASGVVWSLTFSEIFLLFLTADCALGMLGSKKILGVALTADAEEFFLGKKSRERKKIPHFF